MYKRISKSVRFVSADFLCANLFSRFLDLIFTFFDFTANGMPWPAHICVQSSVDPSIIARAKGWIQHEAIVPRNHQIRTSKVRHCHFRFILSNLFFTISIQIAAITMSRQSR